MKTKKLILPLSLLLVLCMLGILIYWYADYRYENNIAIRRNFEKQLGTYRLDIQKTELGAYAKDSLLYKKLEITFCKDSTFYMNMSVPFIYDSSGKWNAAGGGLEDWNWLWYKSNPEIRTQFDQCSLTDSTFLLNSATPQKEQKNVARIFFNP